MGALLCAQQMFVINRSDDNVLIFEVTPEAFSREDGGFLGVFGETVGNLSGPTDLLFEPSTGRLFVVDGAGQTGSAVVVFEPAGAFAGDFGDTRANLRFPSSLAFHPVTGNLLVSERNIFVTFQGAVREFDAETGALVGTFGQTEGNVNQPLVLAFQPTSGDLFVLDCPRPAGAIDCDVRRFDGVTGEFLGIFGQTADAGNAVDMAFDPLGTLYLLEGSSVLAFDSGNGELLQTFDLSPIASPVSFSVVAAPSPAVSASTGRRGPTQNREELEIHVVVTAGDGSVQIFWPQEQKRVFTDAVQGTLALGQSVVAPGSKRITQLNQCVLKLQSLIDQHGGLLPEEKQQLGEMVSELAEIIMALAEAGSEGSELVAGFAFAHTDVMVERLQEIVPELPEESLAQIFAKIQEIRGVLISFRSSRLPDGGNAALEPLSGTCTLTIGESGEPIFDLAGFRRPFTAVDQKDVTSLFQQWALVARVTPRLLGQFEWSVEPAEAPARLEEDPDGDIRFGINLAFTGISVPKSVVLAHSGEAFNATYLVKAKFTEINSPNRTCEDTVEVRIRIPATASGPSEGLQSKQDDGPLRSASRLQPLSLPAAELVQRLEGLRGGVASSPLNETERTLLLRLLDFVENRIDEEASAPVIAAQLEVFRAAVAAAGADLSDALFLSLLLQTADVRDLLLAEGFAPELGAPPPVPPPGGQCAVRIFEAEPNHFVRSFSAVETPFAGTVLLSGEARKDLAAEARDELGAPLAGQFQWSIEPEVEGADLRPFSPSRPELVSTGPTLDKQLEAVRGGSPLSSPYRVRVHFTASDGRTCQDAADIIP